MESQYHAILMGIWTFSSLDAAGGPFSAEMPTYMRVLSIVFAVFAVALRDKSGKSALDYSKDLVDGQWGTVLWTTARLGFSFSWRAILVGLLYAVLVYLPLGFIAPEDSTELITSIMDDVIMYALLPFLYVMHTIYFLNLDYLRNGSTERQDSETQDLVNA